MLINVLSNKRFTYVKSINGHVPRFYWSKSRRKKMPSVLVKCGCCSEKVRIYYDHDDVDDNEFEINGVLAHKDIWKMLFKEIGLI